MMRDTSAQDQVLRSIFGVYWRGSDELAQLVRRELMLDTMLQNTPVAMLLMVAVSDDVRRIGFSNNLARKLLHDGRKLEGQHRDDVPGSTPRSSNRLCSICSIFSRMPRKPAAKRSHPTDSDVHCP